MWSTKKIVILISFVSVITLLFFQNCSAPVHFEEAAPVELSSSSSSQGLLINNGDEFTNNQIVSLQIEVNNAAEMYITDSPDCSSGGSWVPASSQSNWQLKSLNANATVYAKFRSTYGTETPCVQDSIVHDNIKPVLNAQSLPPRTKDDFTQVTLTQIESGSGISRLICSSGLPACALSMRVENTSDGPKNYSVYAVDKAGNTSDVRNLSWTVDKTPPSKPTMTGPPAKTSSQTAAFVFSSDDAQSLTVSFRCQLTVSGTAGAYSNCQKNHTIANLAVGTYSMKVVAMDDLGNTSVESDAHTWEVKRGLPVVVIKSGPDEYTNNKNVPIVFEGKDQFDRPLARFECKLNNAANWTTCTSPYGLSALTLAQGAQNFQVRGVDVDDIISFPEIRNWNYDTVPPEISFKTKPALFTNKHDEIVELNVSGTNEIKYSLDGALLATQSSSTYTLQNLPERNHVLNVVASDRAGNTSSLNHVFNSDYTAPRLSFAAASTDSNGQLKVPTPTKSTSMTFEVNAWDNYDPGSTSNTVLSYSYLADLGTESTPVEVFSVFNRPFLSLQDIKHGSHQVKLYVTDSAGNRADYLSTTFLVDLRTPIILVDKMPNISVRPNTAETMDYLIEDHDSGLKSVSCKLAFRTDVSATSEVIYDRSCNSSATGYEIQFPSEGFYNLTVTAEDMVGNIARRDIEIKSSELYEEKNQTFTVSQQLNKAVDILFVLDNSKSMDDEKKRISDAFSSFINNLTGIDYRIAIKTTDVGVERSRGTLLPMNDSGTIRYIDKNTPNALAMLQQTLLSRTTGSGDETGLRTIDRFIAGTKAVSSFEYQFYRPAAVLATVVITDSDEAKYLTGYQTAKDFLDNLNVSLPNKTYINHSDILLPDDSDANCLANAEARGITYYEVSMLTGGTPVSICDPDAGTKLSNFATEIITKVLEQTLLCAPMDRDADGKPDIHVYKPNGQEITDYRVVGNKLSFSSPLTDLGEYSIRYVCIK